MESEAGAEDIEVVDVDQGAVSEMSIKLVGTGMQILPLEKLELLEFQASRDLISPMNADINIFECLKVQFSDLERPATFALFDRMQIEVEPLSIHATVKDIEVVQQILTSVAGSWNSYAEYCMEFAKA